MDRESIIIAGLIGFGVYYFSRQQSSMIDAAAQPYHVPNQRNPALPTNYRPTSIPRVPASEYGDLLAAMSHLSTSMQGSAPSNSGGAPSGSSGSPPAHSNGAPAPAPSSSSASPSTPPPTQSNVRLATDEQWARITARNIGPSNPLYDPRFDRWIGDVANRTYDEAEAYLTRIGG